MKCNTCGQEMLFVEFYEGAGEHMAAFYCDRCFKRKAAPIKTEFFQR